MKSALKIVVGLVLAAVVLLGGIGAYFKFFFDPNDIRQTVAQAVEKETGRRFVIEGDLDITVFPWLGFEVGRTRLGEDPAFGEGDFLAFDSASARVKLLPLLSRRIEIDRLTVQGLTVELIRDERGNDNWATLAGQGDPGAAPEPAAETGGTAFTTERIGGVSVENARVSMIDRQAGTTMRVTGLDARTGSIRPGAPVSLEANFTLEASEPALTADVRFSGTGRVDGEEIVIESPELTVTGRDQNLTDGMAVARFELGVRAPSLRVTEPRIDLAEPEVSLSASGDAVGGDLELSVTADGVTLSLAEEKIDVPKPSVKIALAGESLPPDFRITLDAAAAEMAAGGKTLTLRDYKLSTLGLSARGTATVSDLDTKPTVSGPLEVATFSLRELLARLDIPVETADDSVLTRVSAAGQLRASADAAGLSGMTLKLDDSTVRGALSVANFERPAYTFDVTVDAIDVDRYLAPGAAPDEGEAGSAADAIELPTELLRTLQMNGSLKVGALKVAGLETREVNVGIQAGSGRMRVHPSTAKLYGGTYTGDIRIDASGELPVLSLNETVTGIDFAAFAGTVMPRNPLAGRLNGNVLLSGRGTNTAQLQQTLNGSMRFDFEDGVIRNIDLWHGVRSVIALADRSAPPPAPTPRQTRFEQLTGSAKVIDGVIATDTLAASVPHLDVDGGGRVDLKDRSVDFRVQARIVEEEGSELLPRERKLVGFRVPVYIGGTIDAPEVQKDRSVGDVVAQLAKRKLADKLGLLKKEPAEGAEPGTDEPASQEDAEQSLDEKKEDLKDKVDKKAKDLLKDLIG